VVKLYDINRELISFAISHPPLLNVLEDEKIANPLAEKRYLQLWLNQLTTATMSRKSNKSVKHWRSTKRPRTGWIPVLEISGGRSWPGSGRPRPVRNSIWRFSVGAKQPQAACRCDARFRDWKSNPARRIGTGGDSASSRENFTRREADAGPKGG
jgi:hypothetical protein